ncbi:MAG: hypothetical protein ABEJ99_01160 [Candidatus Nanohaloarchaea archaeon]
MSIQTTREDDTARTNPGWSGPTGTGRDTYSIEIDEETADSLIDTYSEEDVENSYSGTEKLSFYDARSSKESVRIMKGDNYWAHYSRPKETEKEPVEELVDPLLQETGTEREFFQSMLE